MSGLSLGVLAAQITQLPFSLEYLLIAGGGGSSTGASGAGGLLTGSLASPTLGTAYSVTIGGGGARGDYTVQGSQGSNSVFSSFTAIGGGFGGGRQNNFNGTGGSGGSAGATGQPGRANGTATAGQGNAAGVYASGQSWFATLPGAGGAGSAGGNADRDPNVPYNGVGGSGFTSSITGSPVTYAGGGGGYGMPPWGIPPAAGGSGGGTAGSYNASVVNPAANTGAGAGGVTYDAGGGIYLAGNGGSGVLILRFPTGYTANFSAGITRSTATSGSFTVITVTAGSGTVTFS